jgi:iron complex outermembrane receptor protein
MKQVFKLKRLLLAFFLILMITNVFSQKRITGKVTDESTGSPLIGATVLNVGTTKGTTTDFDGLYTIDASDGARQDAMAAR